MSDMLLLSNSVLSFPQLVEPRSYQEGQPKKYSADLILDPNGDDWKRVMQAVMTAAQAKWGDNAQAVLQMIQSDRKLRAFGSGAEKVDKKTFKPYDGYEGKVYVSGINANPPQMIQSDGKAIDPANTMAYQAMARKMYGGCYVNAAVKIWVQDNKYGRGIRCELTAVQFAKDGTPFGDAVPDASNLFGAVAAAPAGAAPAGMAFPAFMQ
jgi:hypothetical protein